MDKMFVSPFYGMPREMLIEGTLSWFSKFLWRALVSLSKKEGYCFASNQYLADLFAVDTRTIQRGLQQLAAKGWVLIAIESGKSRKIYVQVARDKADGRDVKAGQNSHTDGDRVTTSAWQGRQHGHGRGDNTVVRGTSTRSWGDDSVVMGGRQHCRGGHDRTVTHIVKDYNNNIIIKYNKKERGVFVKTPTRSSQQAVSKTVTRSLTDDPSGNRLPIQCQPMDTPTDGQDQVSSHGVSKVQLDKDENTSYLPKGKQLGTKVPVQCKRDYRLRIYGKAKLSSYEVDELLVDEEILALEQEFNPADPVDRILENFKAYVRAKQAPRGRPLYHDCHGAFRNWLARECQFARQKRSRLASAESISKWAREETARMQASGELEETSGCEDITMSSQQETNKKAAQVRRQRDRYLDDLEARLWQEAPPTPPEVKHCVDAFLSDIRRQRRISEQRLLEEKHRRTQARRLNEEKAFQESSALSATSTLLKSNEVQRLSSQPAGGQRASHLPIVSVKQVIGELFDKKILSPSKRDQRKDKTSIATVTPSIIPMDKTTQALASDSKRLCLFDRKGKRLRQDVEERLCETLPDDVIVYQKEGDVPIGHVALCKQAVDYLVGV